MERSSKWATGTAIGAAALSGGLALWTALGARAATAMVPRDGQLADVPGGSLHYTDRGNGPPIVMLHGLLGQLRHYSYALADRLVADHRLVLVDRPGWGYSTVEGAQPGIVEQANMVAALIRGLGLERPVIVGHSMGGALALALALEHPDLVGGLGLIAPLTQPPEAIPPMFERMYVPSPAVRGVLSWTLAVPMGMLGATRAAQAIFAPDPVPGDFASRGGGALALRPASFRAGSAELQLSGEAMAVLPGRYAEIATPTAILYGREDAVLDPELHGRKTATMIDGATYETMTGGHMLPIAHPEATEAWLRRLMARVAGTAEAG